jgi:hypothetical protein
MMREIKYLLKSLTLVIFAGSLISCGSDFNPELLEQPAIDNTAPIIESASKSKNKPIQFQMEHGVYQAVVTELLPDDRDGLPHQRFMIELVNNRFSNEEIMVAHNIDHSPRVPVRIGAQLELKGDFILSASPKVLHWTHLCEVRNGVKSHPDGYIRLNGQIYQ